MKFQKKTFGLNSQGWVGLTSAEPKQMLDIAGGNILIRKGAGNPYALNGCLFFGDDTEIFGKWGIEYLSTTQDLIGGVNFFRTSSAEFGGPVNYALFIKNNCNVGIGTNNPIAKFQVEGDAFIKSGLTIGELLRPATLNVFGTINSSSLLATAERYIIGADAQGKLILLNKEQAGDNMGNCVAGFDLNIGNHLIFGAGNKGMKFAPDGEPWLEGLKFIEDKSGEMSLSSFTNTSFTLASLLTTNSSPSDGNSIYWATNSISGGYGFGLTRAGYGGIFGDKNRPSLIMSFNQEGKIGMGCLPGTEKYRLYVKDGIVSEEVLVKLPNANGTWPDYVFDNEYELPNLNSVESFIKINKHLPELPSATEVMENGINVGEMNALLLKKIEELTLYIIDQQKQIDELKNYIQK
jgi:hypothetical protein